MWLVEKLNADNEKRDINTNPNSSSFFFFLAWVSEFKMLCFIEFVMTGRKALAGKIKHSVLGYETFEISRGNSITDFIDQSQFTNMISYPVS